MLHEAEPLGGWLLQKHSEGGGEEGLGGGANPPGHLEVEVGWNRDPNDSTAFPQNFVSGWGGAEKAGDGIRR